MTAITAPVGNGESVQAPVRKSGANRRSGCSGECTGAPRWAWYFACQARSEFLKTGSALALASNRDTSLPGTLIKRAPFARPRPGNSVAETYYSSAYQRPRCLTWKRNLHAEQQCFDATGAVTLQKVGLPACRIPHIPLCPRCQAKADGKCKTSTALGLPAAILSRRNRLAATDVENWAKTRPKNANLSKECLEKLGTPQSLGFHSLAVPPRQIADLLRL